MIVDDEEIVRLAYKNQLKLKGYEVDTRDSGQKALELLNADWPGIVVSDLVMPEMDGISLLGEIKKIDPDLPVVLITGKGEVPVAVKAIQEGAYDFLEKPFNTDSFMDVVRRALEKRRLVMEVRELKTTLDSQKGDEYLLVGKSAVMEKLRQTVRSVAECDVDVLIVGETGSGKDLVARCLHQKSKRRDQRFVSINCGALPETIIESELFGHEAGAFTGADKRRVGKFEYASGGTVFLDEIESMPLHVQVKLLHVLQDRYILRVGSNEMIPVDVRIIAATKIDLKEAYQAGKFRKDLYYRLNVVQIDLPSLPERREDVPLLFQHFVLDACSRYDLPVPAPSNDLLQGLMARDWEGNVRELRNEADKFVLGLNLDLSQSSSSQMDRNSAASQESQTFKQQVSGFEKSLIEQELIRQKGDLKKTQEALQIPKQTLYDKIKVFGLNRKDYV